MCQGIVKTAVVVACIGCSIVAWNSETPSVGSCKCFCRLLIINAASLTTTIRFIYLSMVIKVDFGILSPSVFTISGTEDVGMCESVCCMYILHWGVDVDMSVESASIAVVSAIDCAATGSTAIEVYVRLIYVARILVTQIMTVGRGNTVCTSIEVAHVDG